MITKLKVVLLGRPTRYSLGFKLINLCEAFYIKFSTSILVLRRREMLKLIWNDLNLFFMCYVIEYKLKLFGKSLSHPNPWSIPFLCLLRTDYTLNSSNPFSCVNKAAEIFALGLFNKPEKSKAVFPVAWKITPKCWFTL